MIRYNDRFSFYREERCWTLVERTKSDGVKRRYASVKEYTERKSYYASLEQVLKEIVGRSVNVSGDAQALLAAIADVHEDIMEFLFKRDQAGDIMDIIKKDGRGRKKKS